jgi:NAD(P)-dependent dehydrogenase (short-subunit alcohol dehydrogenase family)
MILDLFHLDGRVALVTGASRGLGQAIAVALAEAGADIADPRGGDVDQRLGDAAALHERGRHDEERHGEQRGRVELVEHLLGDADQASFTANMQPAETPSTSQIGRPMPSRTKKIAANSLVMAIRAPNGLPVDGSKAKQTATTA